MGILSRLFGRKDMQTSSVAVSSVARNAVGCNLPLEHVHARTGCDIEPYHKIADMVQAHSYAAAEEFARLLGRKPTDQIIHFFHDMFTAVCFVPRVSRLSRSKDVGSAIVDGIHFEFYGDAVQSSVDSILQLWAEKPKCFFQTFVQALGKTDESIRFVQFAAYCLNPEIQLGATEALKLSEPFKRIVKEKVSSISTCTDTMLDI